MPGDITFQELLRRCLTARGADPAAAADLAHRLVHASDPESYREFEATLVPEMLADLAAALDTPAGPAIARDLLRHPVARLVQYGPAEQELADLLSQLLAD